MISQPPKALARDHAKSAASAPQLKWRHPAILALVVGVTLAGGWLRFTATSFGLPDQYRPDEEHLIPRALGFGPDWDPHFAFYPAGQMYLQSAALRAYAAALGYWRDFRIPYAGSSSPYLLGRRLTAALGTATIPAAYLAAAPLYGPNAALSAAAIIAFATLHERDSKYATTDVPAAFWTTLAIVMLLRIISYGRTLDYVCAGIFSGLAAATKYPASAILFGVAAAHFERWRREERKPFLCSVTGAKIYLAAGAAIVTAACASPFLILNWTQTLRDFQQQWQFSRYGTGNELSGYGWSWLLLRAMPDAFGVEMQCLILGGILWAIVRPKPGTLSLAAFLIAAFLAITSGHLVFYRYLIIPFPAMAILAGVLISDLAAAVQRAVGRKVAFGVEVLFLAVVLTPSLIRDVEINRLLLRADTRTLTRQWILTHIPPGSLVAAASGITYGKPQLPPDYHILPMEDFGSLRAKHIRWVLSDSLPELAFWSPEPSQSQLAELRAAHATLVFDIDPVRPGTKVMPGFDAADAFYAPIKNVASMERPGPRIRIWELR